MKEEENMIIKQAKDTKNKLKLRSILVLRQGPEPIEYWYGQVARSVPRRPRARRVLRRI